MFQVHLLLNGRKSPILPFGMISMLLMLQAPRKAKDGHHSHILHLTALWNRNRCSEHLHTLNHSISSHISIYSNTYAITILLKRIFFRRCRSLHILPLKAVHSKLQQIVSLATLILHIARLGTKWQLLLRIFLLFLILNFI